MGWAHFLPGLLAHALALGLLGLALALVRKHRGQALGLGMLALGCLPWGDGRNAFWLLAGSVVAVYGFREPLQDRWMAWRHPEAPWRQRSWRHEGSAAELRAGLAELAWGQRGAGRHQRAWRFAAGVAALTAVVMVAGGTHRPGSTAIAWEIVLGAAAWAALLAALAHRLWTRRRGRGLDAEPSPWAQAWLPLLEQAHPRSPAFAQREGRPLEELPAWRELGRPYWDEWFGAYRRHVRYPWWSLAFALPNGARLHLSCRRAAKQHSKRPRRQRDRWKLRAVLDWPPRKAPGGAGLARAWAEAAPEAWHRSFSEEGREAWRRGPWAGGVEASPEGGWRLVAACEGDRKQAEMPGPEAMVLELLAWLEGQRLLALQRSAAGQAQP